MAALRSGGYFPLDGKLGGRAAFAIAIAAALGAAMTGQTANAAAAVDQAAYGTTQGGQAVEIFT